MDIFLCILIWFAGSEYIKTSFSKTYLLLDYHYSLTYIWRLLLTINLHFYDSGGTKTVCRLWGTSAYLIYMSVVSDSFPQCLQSKFGSCKVNTEVHFGLWPTLDKKCFAVSLTDVKIQFYCKYNKLVIPAKYYYYYLI